VDEEKRVGFGHAFSVAQVNVKRKYLSSDRSAHRARSRIEDFTTADFTTWYTDHRAPQPTRH